MDTEGPRKHRQEPLRARRRGDQRSAGAAGAAGLDLATARERLADHRPGKVELQDPRPARGWQAATAVVVAPGPTHLEIAVIQRTVRPGDRWSGQMALPGGKRDPGDPDLAATAARETEEELGLPLPRRPDTRLDDHVGRTRPGIVASFVFTLDERPALRPQPSEVAAAWWLPLPSLLDPANATRHRWAGVPFPGIAHEGQVIWGLTYRTLQTFVATLGYALPRE
jgi:8-oxo-dGTP pyrophosphatase MutT (NUDIX family)